MMKRFDMRVSLAVCFGLLLTAGVAHAEHLTNVIGGFLW
jgi:hypothetical protein